MGVEVSRSKSLIRPLIFTAAVLGIVQGLLWFIMSLISVLFYENKMTPETNVENFSVNIDRTLFDLFLNSENSAAISVYGGIIGPKEFNIYMYFYLVFSFSLLVISSTVLWATINGKSGNDHELELCIWTINMIILSLLDVILVCLIGHDYHKIKGYYTDNLVVETAATTVVFVSLGIVLTMAARGFLLWILNVTFIGIFGTYLYNFYTDKESTQNQPPLDAYNTTGSSRPPWEMPNSLYASDNNRPGYNNKGYRDDNDNPMLVSSSRSFTHLPVNDRDNYDKQDRGNPKAQNLYGNNYGDQNNGNNWNRRNQNDNAPYGGNPSPLRPLSQVDRSSDIPNQWGQPAPQRTAKIGRQGGQRSPPLNVNPPFIPDPDYSPPGSPRFKGVLRPKSNYMY